VGDGSTEAIKERAVQKISPCLWFDGKAEEAVTFYVSVFKNAKITDTMYYGDTGPGAKGSVLSITFRLADQEFIALNGGAHFDFSPAISLFVACETQQEIDEMWGKLSSGGETGRCGWLTDRYGVSWQIVPSALGEMLRDPDTAKSTRVMRTLLTMGKLDLARLQEAYNQ
jgi:predicted 3-demethylubiquinone-9 3-methyltransferase (glyoxalase superfamily)